MKALLFIFSIIFSLGAIAHETSLRDLPSGTKLVFTRDFIIKKDLKKQLLGKSAEAQCFINLYPWKKSSFNRVIEKNSEIFISFSSFSYPRINLIDIKDVDAVFCKIPSTDHDHMTIGQLEEALFGVAKIVLPN